MYRGYELLTWENRLVDVGARRIRKFHQTELEIRLCQVMKRIISQALAVWNRMLAWSNPNMDAEPADAVFDNPWRQASWENKASGKILNLGQIRAGKASGSGSGHLKQQDSLAELLGRKESSVRSNLKRGREKMKMILKEAYDFE